MKINDLSDSGILRLANEASHLYELAGVTSEMGLSQRSNLIFLERSLHELWGLGANSILSWSPFEEGILVLLVPHYAIADYVSAGGTKDNGSAYSETFITELISGKRLLSNDRLRKVGRLLNVEPVFVQLRSRLSGDDLETDVIERMIRRYGINYVPSRAVTLFDIVGFGLLSPFEQMTQLNSLSYSLNSAHAKMMEKDIGVNFARCTTGDGFYVWNRDTGTEANVNLYHFMHLVLADNAIARSKARSNTVPRLRACFDVGSCYEFHQAEGLNPTTHDFIVGHVTIDLARMIDAARPGQIFVGEFLPDSITTPGNYEETQSNLDAVVFLERTQESLKKLSGLTLAGDRISGIKSYLTGEKTAPGQYSIRRIAISDKHGIRRTVYNAKVNIYRENAEPILLGIEDRKLAEQYAE